MFKTSPLLRIWFFAGATALSAFAGVATSAPASAEPQYSKTADISVRYHDNDRVCCKRGYRDWWSNWRECRRAGGYATRNRECRDDRVDYRGGQRVCCQRGRHDWWSTQRQCRRGGGYITYNRACRNDRDNRPFASNRGYNNAYE